MKNNFGASHDFSHQKERVKKNKPIRIGKTFYIKFDHFRRLQEASETEQINISEVIDRTLQRGFAYEEILKAQDERNSPKPFLEKN